jgi:hypothetical protein
MVITAGGNVGIGTTSPLGRTHIQSASTGLSVVNVSGDELIIENSSTAGMTILGGNTSACTIFFADSDSAQVGGIQYDHSDNHLHFRVNGIERARIDSSGRLLVGTTLSTGNHTLVLQGNSAGLANESVLAFRRNKALVNDDKMGVVDFGDNGNFLGAKIEGIADGTWNTVTGTTPGRLVFSTTPSGSSSPTERLRITNAGVLQVADAGNITVGTTNGTKIGTATTQKLGFYNATPVVQPTAVADATDAATAISQLNALLAHMRTLGLIAT